MIRRLTILLLIVGCSTEPEDCAGVAGGDSQLDSCGVCDNDSANDCVQDCAGIWGGDAVSRLMGDIDGDGYFTGFCCEQASCQDNPVNYDDLEGNNEACEGEPVGDAGLLMGIATSLGVGGCGNNIDFIAPENCPQFYWFDINGDGHIESSDVGCVNAYATGQVPTEDGNWYTCVVSDSTNPCYGKHIGEECCISN